MLVLATNHESTIVDSVKFMDSIRKEIVMAIASVLLISENAIFASKA